jgi:hypothetical protein
LEVELFYFGIRFFHLKTRQAVQSSRIPLSIFKKDISKDMGMVIQKDLHKLSANLVGGKKEYKAGIFVKLNGTKTIYVYHHSDHATCSGTKFSHIEGCLEEVIYGGSAKLSECEHQEHEHYSLLPFYYGNRAIVEKYKEIAQKQPHYSSIQAEVEDVEKIVKGEASPEGTPYETPRVPYTLINWNENDWTRRLAPGIQKLLPNRKVTYTATMGLTWYTDLVLKCLDVGEIAVPDHFLFRGSPDIVIGKNIAATLGTTGHEEQESEDDLVENTYQRNSLQGKCPGTVPEKVGEVFAGLYILLVSKILRNLAKQKAVLSEFTVQGILVDKVCGGLHCILSVQLKDGASALNFTVTAYYDGLLEPSLLCSLLHIL